MKYEKLYKEALERASKLMAQTVQNPFNTVGQMVEHIFPELIKSKDERIREALIDFIKHESDLYGIKTWCNEYTTEEVISWLEKQCDNKKSDDEVLKIRQELYQSGYNDGYKHGYNHGQNNIAIALKKESIEALEHFVRGIGESGYASPYDNRTKLVYTLLEQLKQIVK